MALKFERLDTSPPEPYEDQIIRFKDTGNIKEIMSYDRKSKGGYTKKLSKNFYEDTRTGEVKEFSHKNLRVEDLHNLAKSMAKARDIINSNIIDPRFSLWLTLTYRENMRDSIKLLSDFRNFNTRLRKEIGFYEYITAVEAQGRGAWHMHVILIFDHIAPYIPHGLLWRCWSPKGFKAKLKDGKGYDWVFIKKLKDIDNVGAYLTAYLADMDLQEIAENNLLGSFAGSEVTEVEIEENGGKIKKSIIKGARLKFYPAGFHIFRYSKGIKRPDISYISYQEAKKKVGSLQPTFERSFAISDEDTDFRNVLSTKYYNLLRP